jgi:hypothetical protein
MWKCNVDSSLSWPCFRCSDILHSAMSPQGGSGVTITAYTTQSHSFTVCYCHRVQIRPLDFHRRYVRLYHVPYYKENQCHTCFKCVPTVVDIKEKIEVMIRYVWCKRAFAGKCRPTVSIPSDPRTWVASGHLKGTPGDPLSITGEQAGMVPLYCQMFCTKASTKWLISSRKWILCLDFNQVLYQWWHQLSFCAFDPQRRASNVGMHRIFGHRKCSAENGPKHNVRFRPKE